MKTSGDRAWSAAGQATVEDLGSQVREHAKGARHHVGVDAVHDLRTATRRLRTAIELHGQEAPGERRAAVERELKRVSRRLGAVRDLDVLLEALDASTRHSDGPLRAQDLRPLRRAWRRERAASARRLAAELDRRRFRRAVRRARRLVAQDGPGSVGPGADAGAERVATRAPGLIWDAFGAVLAHRINPRTADPAEIHQLRIAAKTLRYTLEAFEDSLEPGTTLIADVSALQDAAGSMHDAIVAADRARSTVKPGDLTKRQRRAAEVFAGAQVREADRQRPAIARHLRTIRSRAFRDSLGRAVAGMGHVRA